MELRRFSLPQDGCVEYAQWLHPHETTKTITQESVDALRTFLRPGEVAIDIGAHTGDTALPIALALGPGGTVFALEPNPYVFPVLARNATLNRDKAASIVALPFAATESSGAFEFDYSDEGYCNGGRHQGISRWRHGHAFTLTVQGENLVEYLRAHHPEEAARVRYVKVDVEGADFAILRSLAPLIEAARPCLRLEVYHLLPAADRAEMAAWLRERGYEVFRMEGETRYRGRPVTSEDLAGGEQFDLFGEPGGDQRS
jgi:FkbM family methyltransferase